VQEGQSQPAGWNPVHDGQLQVHEAQLHPAAWTADRIGIKFNAVEETTSAIDVLLETKLVVVLGTVKASVNPV